MCNIKVILLSHWLFSYGILYMTKIWIVKWKISETISIIIANLVINILWNRLRKSFPVLNTTILDNRSVGSKCRVFTVAFGLVPRVSVKWGHSTAELFFAMSSAHIWYRITFPTWQQKQSKHVFLLPCWKFQKSVNHQYKLLNC